MPSDYQVHSKLFYTTVGVTTCENITGTPERIAEEGDEKRYTNSSVPGIDNLSSLIQGLHGLVCARSPVGLDCGCGAHFFVHQCAELGWGVLGFDAVGEQIELAHKQYPDSSTRYRCHDFLADGIPVPDASQDFLFCNAVCQHFSTPELNRVLADMHRVLKDGGVLLAIFKTKIRDYPAFHRETGIDIRPLDVDEGKVLVDDPLLEKVLASISASERKRASERLETKERLFHLFDVQEMLDAAGAIGFDVVEQVEFVNGARHRGIVEYRTGRCIPSAAVFLRKPKL